MWFGDLVTMQLVERPLAQRVLRRVGLHDVPGRGHRVDRRVDHLRHLREGLGLPPGPALDDPPDRRRDPRPRRTSRSTSTASPTPRAPRCSSSSSPTSAATPSATGLRTYFRTHAWGNTTLDDLLTELEATSGRDLRSWSRLWLETAGVNTLRPLVEVDEYGVITAAAVEQTSAEGYETLRPHRLRIGLYEVRDGALHRTDVLELDVDGDRTEVPAPRRPRRSPTCCSSTTTTSPTPRSASTSARWRPPSPTRGASPTPSPGRWCSPRPGT